LARAIGRESEEPQQQPAQKSASKKQKREQELSAAQQAWITRQLAKGRKRKAEIPQVWTEQQLTEGLKRQADKQADVPPVNAAYEAKIDLMISKLVSGWRQEILAAEVLREELPSADGYMRAMIAHKISKLEAEIAKFTDATVQVCEREREREREREYKDSKVFPV